MQSSPLSPINSSQPKSQLFRPTKELPFELAQHVQVYFEESMFGQGYRFLSSIISSDASTADGPVTLPSPEYLAITSTLSVHPSLTTRTNLRDKREQSNSAMRLLRLLLKTTGPVFNKAFQFTKYTQPASELRTYFTEDSVWLQAEDFWAVVGWAMNCSCLPGMYTARWEYWGSWLDYMLDYLELDWRSHETQDTCEESLLWQYIELAPGGTTRARRMLRAIFADGSASSLNEFRQIFRRELKEPPSDTEKPKRREVDVDVEAEIYGDYLNKDSDTSSAEEGGNNTQASFNRRVRARTPSRKPTPKSSNQSLRSEFDAKDGNKSLGDSKSLTIRLRLLNLLADIAKHPTLTTVSPTTFPSQDELYTLFVEFIKPLPLTTFQQVIQSHHKNILDTRVHITLCAFLLQRSLESAVPRLSSEHHLTQSQLEEEFLPFAASKTTVDANCRVSLLLEALLRLFKLRGLLSGTDRLKITLRIGIETRMNKVADNVGIGGGGGRKRKGVDEDEEEMAWNWLVESGERMNLIVDLLKRPSPLE